MLSSLIGAFTALAARVSASPGLDWAREKRLEAERDALARSRAQLINHIELLERELATERSLADHWLRECQTAYRRLREVESERDRARDIVHAQVAQGAAQQANAQQLQGLNLAQAHQQAMQNSVCTCTPGRSQLFYEAQRAQAQQNALVNRLNQT